MTSSPSFRRELPTSKVAGEISMGLNSPRPEGNLSFMLSHLTLRMQARMKQYAIRPLSLLSASGQINILREIITFSLAFIPYLAKGEFPLANVKQIGSEFLHCPRGIQHRQFDAHVTTHILLTRLTIPSSEGPLHFHIYAR